MYVARRDLRFAKGRFLLIGSVVTLITILVGFLSGLTGGLATQNISAILALPGDRLVFEAPASGGAVSFSDSAVTTEQAAGWAATAGVASVSPIGISQTRVEANGKRAAVALFGVKPGFNADAPSRNGRVSLPSSVATALGVGVGASVTLAGRSLTVERVVPDLWYSHTPVVELTLDDWRAYAAATGSPDAFATVLAVAGKPDWAAADAANATTSQSTIGSLTALEAFKSEIGSLLMMVAMLFAISALVIGAFFTVWTMQRKADVAVLKALGASTAWLVRDALGQALVVLLTGIGLGIAIVAVFGALAGSALPFLLSPLTTLVPGLIMTALGLAGAAFALRSVTSADPLTALGSNR